MDHSVTTPRVSIILPVYNGQEFLDEAIASLVNQTFGDFELLVINDGSTDQSEVVIKAWVAKDPRVRLIQNGEPHGLPHALNTGLRQARGEYVARADQDDIHRPERLTKEVLYLDQYPKIMLVGSAYQPFTTDGPRQPIVHPTQPVMIAWRMLSASAFCHPSVVFRRQIYQELGGYPVTGAEDFAYFSKVVRRWPTANLPDVLVDYREHASNYSITRREAIAQSIMDTFRENLNDYLGPAVDPAWFYTFLVRRHLPLALVKAVKRQSATIIAKISQTYGLAQTDPEIGRLRFHVNKEIVVVTSRTLLGLKPIGQLLKP